MVSCLVYKIMRLLNMESWLLCMKACILNARINYLNIQKEFRKNSFRFLFPKIFLIFGHYQSIGNPTFFSISMYKTMHTKHTCMFSMQETMHSMHQTMFNMHSPENHILFYAQSIEDSLGEFNFWLDIVYIRKSISV